MTTSLSEKVELSKEEVKRLKQKYATPWSFIDWVIDEVLVPRGRGFFGVDVCASQDNAKAATYFDEEQNGLEMHWTNFQNGPAWCNPPFRDVQPWLRKARIEATDRRIMSCVLTHMDHSTDWFSTGMMLASECILVNPRINFVQHPILIKWMKQEGIKPSSNDKQNVLWVFDPAWLPSREGEQAKITYPKPWR